MKAFNWILIVLSALKNVKIREFVTFCLCRPTQNGWIFRESSHIKLLPSSDTKLEDSCFKDVQKIKIGAKKKTKCSQTLLPKYSCPYEVWSEQTFLELNCESPLLTVSVKIFQNCQALSGALAQLHWPFQEEVISTIFRGDWNNEQDI